MFKTLIVLFVLASSTAGAQPLLNPSPFMRTLLSMTNTAQVQSYLGATAIRSVISGGAVSTNDNTIIYAGPAAQVLTLPDPFLCPGKLLYLRDASGQGFSLAPPPPDQVIIESRTNGLNNAAYTDSGYANSTLKSSAAGCTTNLGSRYAFTNISSITLTPTLALSGAMYLLEVTHGYAASVSTDVVMNVSVQGGIFTNSDTTTSQSVWTMAFQQPSPNLWKPVGNIQLNAGVYRPTLTFTTTNVDLSSSSNRIYSDAFRLTSNRGVPPTGSVILQSDGRVWWTISESPSIQ